MGEEEGGLGDRSSGKGDTGLEKLPFPPSQFSVVIGAPQLCNLWPDTLPELTVTTAAHCPLKSS